MSVRCAAALRASLIVLLALPSAAAPPGEVRDWSMPPRGRGVVLTLAEGRTVAGVSLGLRDGAAWVGVDGGEVGIALEEVVAAAAAATDEASYRARVRGLPPGDAAAAWTLARWAKARGLHGRADEAARLALAADADHAGARELLGYERLGCAWRLKEERLAREAAALRHRALAARAAEDERAAREEERRLFRAALAAIAAAPANGSPAVSEAPRGVVWLGGYTFQPRLEERLGPDPGRTEGGRRRGDGPYTVPAWKGPFSPSFHQGYFDRRIPLR